MKKYILGFLVLGLFVGLPLITKAVTVDELMAQANSLINQVSILSTQLEAQVSRSITPVSVPTTTKTSVTTIPRITTTTTSGISTTTIIPRMTTTTTTPGKTTTTATTITITPTSQIPSLTPVISPIKIKRETLIPEKEKQKILVEIEKEREKLYFEQNKLIEIKYTFTAPVLSKEKIGNITYDSVTMANAPSFGDVGAPVLPVYPVEILLPYRTDIAKTEVILGQKIAISGNYNIEPGQKSIPILPPEELKKLGFSLEPTKPDLKFYTSKGPYPTKKYTPSTTQSKKGYEFALLNLNPVEYIPQNKQLSYYKDITVKITLKEGEIAPTFRGLNTDAEEIEQLTVAKAPEYSAEVNKMKRKERSDIKAVEQKTVKQKNLEALSTYEQLPIKDATGKLLSLIPSENYKYIIITTNKFKSAFQPLIDWKKTRPNDPITAKVVTIEEILNNKSFSCYGPYNWGDGCGSQNQFDDEAAKIRYFIRYAYTNWGTEYVLLGGDADKESIGDETEAVIIPVRYFQFQSTVPSDVYYSNLDGSWDPDDNGEFGGSSDFNFNLDLESEVAVGRAPFDNSVEINNWVNKTIYYESHPIDYGNFQQIGSVTSVNKSLNSTYVNEQKNSYMVGGYLGFGVFSEYAGNQLEEIRFGVCKYGYCTSGFTPSFNESNVKTLYDSNNNYPPGYDSSELVNLINSNSVHIINHLGHCGRTSCLKLTNDIVDTSLNNTKPIFIYSQGCEAGSFDNWNPEYGVIPKDVFAEHLLESQNGAFAVVMNSRYGMGGDYGSSQAYNRSFWDGIFSSNMENNLGKINSYSHEKNNYLFYSGSFAYNYYTTNLLGDPETKLKTPKFEKNLRVKVYFDNPAYISYISNVNVINNNFNDDIKGRIEVANQGLYNETNVSLKLYLDNQQIFSQNILNIPSNDSVGINYTVPHQLFLNSVGKYITLRAEVAPVSGEVSLFDNDVSEKIWTYNYDPFWIQSDNYIFDCNSTQNPTGQIIPKIVGPRNGSAIIPIFGKNNITIRNCELSGGGIFIYSSDGNSIENNHIYNISSNGLSISNSNNNTIKDNKICNNNDYPPYSWGVAGNSIIGASGSGNNFDTINSQNLNWPIYGVHYCRCNEIWNSVTNICLPTPQPLIPSKK